MRTFRLLVVQFEPGRFQCVLGSVQVMWERESGLADIEEAHPIDIKSGGRGCASRPTILKPPLAVYGSLSGSLSCCVAHQMTEITLGPQCHLKVLTEADTTKSLVVVPGGSLTGLGRRREPISYSI